MFQPYRSKHFKICNNKLLFLFRNNLYNKKLNFLEVKVQFLEYIFYELLLTNTEYRNRVCRELMY